MWKELGEALGDLAGTGERVNMISAASYKARLRRLQEGWETLDRGKDRSAGPRGVCVGVGRVLFVISKRGKGKALRRSIVVSWYRGIGIGIGIGISWYWDWDIVVLRLESCGAGRRFGQSG